jgi:hypothetical protein
MARFSDYVVNLFVRGDADSEFTKLEKKAGKLEKKLDKVQGKAGGVRAGLQKMGEGVSKVAIGVGVATAAFGKLAVAYGEQVKVDKQLQFALRNTGLAAAEVAQKFADATAKFAENQQQTIFGDEEQAAALGRLIQVTGDYDTALGLLDTTLDLATASGKSLEKSARAIGDTWSGTLGPLKSFGILTQEQIKSFNEMEDATRRGAAGMDVLKDKIGGARLEVGDIAQSAAQLQNDFGDVEQAAGGFAVGMGDLILEMIGFKDETKESTSALSGFAGQMSNATKNIRTYVDNTTLAEKATDAWFFSIKGGLVTSMLGLNSIDDRLNEVAATAHRNARGLRAAAKEAEEMQARLSTPIGPERTQQGPAITPPRDEAYMAALEKQHAAEIKKNKDAAKKRAADRKAAADAEKAELADLLNFEATEQKKRFFDQVGLEQEAATRREEIARLGLELVDEGNAARAIEIEQQIELLQLADQELTATERQIATEQAARRAKDKLQRVEEKAVKEAAAGAKHLADAQKAQNDVAFAAVAGGIAVADSLIENERAIAAIKAAFEAAQAVAAGASGNIPGAIGHAAASVQFAAVAGGAGSGGAAATGAASQAAGKDLAPQAEQQARETGKIFAEELAAAQDGGRGGIQVNIDMGSSVNLESSAATARRINAAIQGAALDTLRRD